MCWLAPRMVTEARPFCRGRASILSGPPYTHAAARAVPAWGRADANYRFFGGCPLRGTGDVCYLCHVEGPHPSVLSEGANLREDLGAPAGIPACGASFL